MANILTVTRGLPSVLYSSVELARRLASDGHRVIFAGAPDARRLVEHLRLDFLPLESSRYEEFLYADGRAGALERLLHVRRRRERALQSLGVASFARAVRELRPDLILINGEMHEHIIAAWAAGLPMALLSSFVSIWRQPGLPPPHHFVRPGVGWKGTRLGISLLWQALRLEKRRRAALLWAQRIGCDRLSLLRLLARDAGLDFRRETDGRQWLKPFTYRRLPVLSLHALEFEFPHRPPERVHYVGPMVLESRIDHVMSEEEETRLEAIFERRRGSRGKRKLVYAGFGSVFSTDLNLLRHLIEVVSERPDWDLVISLSGRVTPGELGPLPDRVHAFAWVPQMDVLRHADGVVTHGGINTVDECVLSGVPMLVYCGLETDMAGTTARVVHHGIGIAGDRRADDPRTIREHLVRLLHEPRFQDNVARLRRQYAAYRENRVAERAVESLLRSKGR